MEPPGSQGNWTILCFFSSFMGRCLPAFLCRAGGAAAFFTVGLDFADLEDRISRMRSSRLSSIRYNPFII